MRTIDYRLTDAICDPENTQQKFTGEGNDRLPARLGAQPFMLYIVLLQPPHVHPPCGAPVPAEELVRLPGCFLCFTPPPPLDSPPVGPLPALTNGFITFGSFNTLQKQTPEASVPKRLIMQ